MTRELRSPSPLIDIHIHVLPPDACGDQAYVSSKQWNWPPFLLLRLRYRLKRRESIGGNGIIRGQLARAVADMRAVDRVVALALDGVYDGAGRRDNRRTHFYVSNDYVFQLAKAERRFLPGVSVNPRRRDALEELDRCIDLGAVLLKWLPSSQGFDLMDPAVVPFYRRMAQARLPLLCHTGPEYALTTAEWSVGRLERLRLALDEGVTVIAAHGGGVDILNLGRAFHTVAEMLLKYTNLYADTSAFTQPNRSWFLRRFLRHPELHPKLVHGSDVPLPIIPWLFLRSLSFREILRLSQVASPIDRDYLIKQALGFPDSIFRRGSELLRMDRASP